MLEELADEGEDGIVDVLVPGLHIGKVLQRTGGSQPTERGTSSALPRVHVATFPWLCPHPLWWVTPVVSDAPSVGETDLPKKFYESKVKSIRLHRLKSLQVSPMPSRSYRQTRRLVPSRMRPAPRLVPGSNPIGHPQQPPQGGAGGRGGIQGKEVARC